MYIGKKNSRYHLYRESNVTISTGKVASEWPNEL